MKSPINLLLLKIAPFFKYIITLCYLLLSTRWFKIKSFINEITFLQSLFWFLLHHLLFIFFICFWCKLRRDIRVTIFFLNIVSYERVVEKSFFRMLVISYLLINWFSLTRPTILWSISESNFLFLPEPGLLPNFQISFRFLFRKYRFDFEAESIKISLSILYILNTFINKSF